VVGGSFTNGEYTPWPGPTSPQVPLEKLAGTVSKVVDLAAPVVTAAVGAAWLASAAKLLGQLAETSGAVRELVEQHARQSRPLPLGPDGLKRLLRRASIERPVACLLEDIDQVSGRQVWWSQFLLPFAAEVVRDLRLLLVVSLTGPAELGAHERDEPQPLYVARRLVERGRARWRPLQPLTVEDISAWLQPCSPVLAARLHAATAGDPRWLRELWDDWQSRRVVHRIPDGTWQLTGADSASLGAINDLLDARLCRLLGTHEPARLEAARELLATAALEGPRFTAQAVADVLRRDPDEVIDLLDDSLTATEDRTDGLVVDLGFLEIQDPKADSRFVNRYQFVSTLHWHTLRRYGLGGPAETARRSEEYAWALDRAYAPQQARVAAIVADLLTAAGNRGAAVEFRRRADFDNTLEAQRSQALAVLQLPKEDWDEWDYIQGTALLLGAGEAMEHRYPLQETLEVYKGAIELAQRAGLRHEQVLALFRCGGQYLQLGNFTLAREHYEAARALAWELGNRQAAADAAHQLGHLQKDQDQLSGARASFEEALDSYRHLGQRFNEAVVEHDLGDLDRQEGELISARQRLNAALTAFRHYRDRPKGEHQLANVLANLAELDEGEGNLSGAYDKASEALRLRQKLGERGNEASTWVLLGRFARKQGELNAAGRYYEQALALYTERHSLIGEAKSLSGLAKVAVQRNKHEEARDRLIRALGLAQLSEHGYLEAVIWDQLADLAVDLNRPSLSCPLRATAVAIFQSIKSLRATRAGEATLNQLQEMGCLDAVAGDAALLVERAQDDYRTDRGWASVRAAFGALDDLEPEPPPMSTKTEPPLGIHVNDR
jgi:tetratricopeptide (TPR) repeat protein